MQNQLRRLEILVVDDDANAGPVKAISTAMLEGGIDDRPVDVLLAPYSSALSEVASKLANERGALLMAAGASATSVYKNRTKSFGMLSPSITFLKSGVELLASRGIRSIALLSEIGDSASVQFCDGANATAGRLGIRVTDSIRVSLAPNSTEISQALAQFHLSKPDAVVGCTHFDVCAEFLRQAASNPDFYVQAMLFTLCVTDPLFKNLPKIQTAYVMGVTPWSELDNQTDELQGWSPAAFGAKFARTFGQLPPYQAVAAYVGGLLLVKAIEESDSLEPKVVAAQLARTRARTVFGNVSFDANRQNVAPFITLQSMPTGAAVVVEPSNAILPMPAWRQRSCEAEARCANLGGCQDDGRCAVIECTPGYRTVKEEKSRRCEACSKGMFSTSGSAEICSVCSPGYFQPKEGQFGCIGCDNLGDFYQELPSQTRCVSCARNTRRYLGVLSAANRTACQCKEGVAESGKETGACVPSLPVARRGPSARLLRTVASGGFLGRRRWVVHGAGFYNTRSTAGEVRTCSLSCRTMSRR